jgi:hypothetical protein
VDVLAATRGLAYKTAEFITIVKSFNTQADGETRVKEEKLLDLTFNKFYLFHNWLKFLKV